MKKIIALISFAFFSALNLWSQEEENLELTENKYYTPKSYGIFIGAKAGVNANDAPSGIQNAIMINRAPEFGGIFYAPLSENENLGFIAELAYSRQSFNLEGYFSKNEYNNSYDYIVFSPSIFLKGFKLGFALGLPLGGECGDNSVSSKDMNAYAAFKIGGEIPLYEDESGRLNVFISGEYSLTRTISSFETNFKKFDVYKESLAYQEENNPYIKPEFKNTITQDLSFRPASITIGLNYYFNMRSEPNK